MKLEKTKNATRNIASGVVLKIFETAVPFALRTAMIYTLGVQYLGLNSLCTSVLSFLNLAELGVGGAMVYSMYKPIAEDDPQTIRALMKLYRFLYRVIGFVILVMGLVLSLFLDQLIAGEVPTDISIHTVYYMNLALTVLSYWLFAYKNCLLTAHQREDIKSNISVCVNFAQYLLQAIVLLVFRNYYAYLVIALVAIVVKNIVAAINAQRLYPQYYCDGEVAAELKRDIFCRVRDLFTAKVGGVVINSADTLVISAFLGLAPLAIYNNYFYIINSVGGFMMIMFNAVRAGIGNSIITESKEKVYKDFETFTFMTQWVVCFCTCCMVCLYQPFMTLWVGKELLLDYGVVIMLCIIFYLSKSLGVLNTYKDAAGIWHSDRFRPLISAIFNLIINLILVQRLGMYGIAIGTVSCYLFITLPWLTYNCFKNLFKRSVGSYMKKFLMYTFVTVVASFTCNLACTKLNNGTILSFIGQMIMCCIIPNVIFVAIYFRTEEFKVLKKMLMSSISGIIK